MKDDDDAGSRLFSRDGTLFLRCVNWLYSYPLCELNTPLQYYQRALESNLQEENYHLVLLSTGRTNYMAG